MTLNRPNGDYEKTPRRSVGREGMKEMSDTYIKLKMDKWKWLNVYPDISGRGNLSR